jgi:hypothetical protein
LQYNTCFPQKLSFSFRKQWLDLKKEYLTLQKESMKAMKKSVQEKKAKTSCYKSEPEEKHKPSIEFTPNVIIHVKIDPLRMSMTRQQIKVHVQGVGEISIILLFSH